MHPEKILWIRTCNTLFSKFTFFTSFPLVIAVSSETSKKVQSTETLPFKCWHAAFSSAPLARLLCVTLILKKQSNVMNTAYSLDWKEMICTNVMLNRWSILCYSYVHHACVGNVCIEASPIASAAAFFVRSVWWWNGILWRITSWTSFSWIWKISWTCFFWIQTPTYSCFFE